METDEVGKNLYAIFADADRNDADNADLRGSGLTILRESAASELNDASPWGRFCNGIPVAVTLGKRRNIMQNDIERSSWSNYLREFNQRNRSRSTKVEIFGEMGAPRIRR